MSHKWAKLLKPNKYLKRFAISSIGFPLTLISYPLVIAARELFVICIYTPLRMRCDVNATLGDVTYVMRSCVISIALSGGQRRQRGKVHVRSSCWPLKLAILCIGVSICVQM